MREMVLNHASMIAPDHTVAMGWIQGLVEGMRALTDSNIAHMYLRTSKEFDQIQCAPNTTLYDISYLMFRWPVTKDNAQFFMYLSSRRSLLKDSSPDLLEKIAGCELSPFEQTQLASEEAKPLLYCAMSNGIAAGFPSAPIWDCDQINVHFDELLPNDEIVARTETVDNLTRAEHRTSITERHRANMRDVSGFEELWERRSEIFPCLKFGPDVEDQLRQINPSALSAIVKKLSILDRDAAEWRDADTAMPEWSCRVRPESNNVRNNPSLIEARRFRSCNGNSEIFEWHADFGYDRIHLRFDSQTKEVEIGYIGEHLPL